MKKQIIGISLMLSCAVLLCACGGKTKKLEQFHNSAMEEPSGNQLVLEGLVVDGEITKGEILYDDHSSFHLSDEDMKTIEEQVRGIAEEYNRAYWGFRTDGEATLKDVLDPFYLSVLDINRDVLQDIDYWSLEHVGGELGQYDKEFLSLEPRALKVGEATLDNQQIKCINYYVLAQITFKEDNPFLEKDKIYYVNEVFTFFDENGEWKLYNAKIGDAAEEEGVYYTSKNAVLRHIEGDFKFHFPDLYAYNGMYMNEEETSLSYEDWLKTGEE